MADRMLFISWGAPVRGAEERAIEVFNQTVGLYGRLQQDGRIEGFDIALFEPNATMNGYAALRGSAEQIAGVRADEEYRRVMIDASLIVDELCQIEGATNEGVAEEMAMYQAAIAKVPQRA